MQESIGKQDPPKPPVDVEMSWAGDLRFDVEGDLRLTLDGDSQAGISPMKALLASLCACMAIDIVHILVKGRTQLKSLRVTARGTRRETHPRSFRSISFHFVAAGERVSELKLQRAIGLSFEKYCSVYNSMNPAIEIIYTTALE